MALIQDNEVYHYHLDHLGTPRELTNQKGDIVWKVRYKTWGNVALKECEEIENNLRFQGQYFDEETGLHYNRHRYYNPGTGQFISQDPIGLLGGVNNYQYAPNPVGWIDPFGLCKDDPNRIYSAKELLRRAEEPGPFHNFPEIQNKEIFAGTRTIIKGDYVLYMARGTITLPGEPFYGKVQINYGDKFNNPDGQRVREITGYTPSRIIEGLYEIGVRPSLSGRTETIVHRFFRKDE